MWEAQPSLAGRSNIAAPRDLQHPPGVGRAGLHRCVAIGCSDRDNIQLRAGQGQQYRRRVVDAGVGVYGLPAPMKTGISLRPATCSTRRALAVQVSTDALP